jgi:hypothetical protein
MESQAWVGLDDHGFVALGQSSLEITREHHGSCIDEPHSQEQKTQRYADVDD